MFTVDLVELLLVGSRVLVWVEEQNGLLVEVGHLRDGQVVKNVVKRPVINQTDLSENPSEVYFFVPVPLTSFGLPVKFAGVSPEATSSLVLPLMQSVTNSRMAAN